MLGFANEAFGTMISQPERFAFQDSSNRSGMISSLGQKNTIILFA